MVGEMPKPAASLDTCLELLRGPTDERRYDQALLLVTGCDQSQADMQSPARQAGLQKDTSQLPLPHLSQERYSP